MELGVKFLECSIVELSIIASDNGVGKSKLIDDGFQKETFDLALSNAHQGFCLHPFGKIVDNNNEKLSLTSC